ncbi:MAG: thioester domain-containing protein [Oscillospiraceae bacterium]|nr:thioester domain-containing protein [Oscillospiraceae bacterium]
MVQLPRGDDPNQTGWGHSAMTFANGWHSAASTHTTAKGFGSYSAPTVYCIEPGVPLNSGDTLNQKGEDFWDEYPENLNATLEAYQIKQFIGRIFVYGYTGNNNLNWNSTNPTHADQIANMLATQFLVWETVVGDRDSNFNWVAAPSGTSNIIAMLASNHPLRSEILAHYDRIVASVKNHVSRPSFLAGNLAGASTYDLAWDGSKYSVTLTDTNNLLGNFTFSSTTPGVSFSVSGNKLTISTTTPPTGTIDITANKSGNVRKTTVVWTDYIMSNKTSGQIHRDTQQQRAR